MISKLSQEFLEYYRYINEKDLDKSRESYNKIVNSLKANNDFLDMDDFTIILNRKVPRDKNIKIKKALIDYICDFFKYISVRDNKKAENAVKCIRKLLTNDETLIDMNELISRLKKDLDILELSENIKDKIDRTFNYGICIMDVESEYQISILRKIIDEIENIKMICIENKTKVVIMNKNSKISETMKIDDEEEKFDASKLYGRASGEYRNRDYRKCIELLNFLFKNEELKISTCGRIGLCYMMLKQYNLAIDYLTLATSINKQKIPKYDYTELIFQLKNQMPSNEKKTNFTMSEEEFFDDMNKYYGIDCIDSIITNVNNGFTVEDSCRFMNLSEDETNIVYLIYARECYYNSDYKNGDKFIKLVQKQKNISRYVKEILKEILVNRMYYKNRKRNESDAKILKLNNK